NAKCLHLVSAAAKCGLDEPLGHRLRRRLTLTLREVSALAAGSIATARINNVRRLRKAERQLGQLGSGEASDEQPSRLGDAAIEPRVLHGNSHTAFARFARLWQSSGRPERTPRRMLQG